MSEHSYKVADRTSASATTSSHVLSPRTAHAHIYTRFRKYETTQTLARETNSYRERVLNFLCKRVHFQAVCQSSKYVALALDRQTTYPGIYRWHASEEHGESWFALRGFVLVFVGYHSADLKTSQIGCQRVVRVRRIFDTAVNGM